jgi:phosphoribosylanthranilate isomerase
VQIVGVFVNEQPQTINGLAAELDLDWVQLSGHETLASASAIERPVVKAIRFDDHASEREWLAQSAQSVRRYPLLVDAHVAGSFGGAGVTSDWSRAAELAGRWPIWLAGGLGPDNVAQAALTVRPQLVDVSSGVETDGVKDIAKIQAFMRAAKQAGAALSADSHAARV